MSSKEKKSAKRVRIPEFRPAHQRLRSSSHSHSQSSSSSKTNISWSTTIRHSNSGNRFSVVELKPFVREQAEVPTPSNDSQGGPNSEGNRREQSILLSNKLKRKRKNTVKSRLTEWLTFRDSTLDELLRHDGLATSSGLSCATPKCNGREELFRCRDCGHGLALYCQNCLVSKHQELELHRVERWQGKFFEKSSLMKLGLRVQLGHDGREICPCPSPGPLAFMVFDISGAHKVNINYCSCNPQNPIPRHVQLLRKGWFPATLSRPQTVFTFSCLDTFHESTLQGKGNLYDFYHMLLRKTDNANLDRLIYRLPELHRVFRLWRNMMIWKRAGRGQDPSGIHGTSPGGLTVECPACPHPGQNLPDNWRDAGALIFLYTLYIAVDANFKLKGKNRKLEDVDLIGNCGIFVDESGYQEHIKSYNDQPEINTCQAEHDAVVRASIRNNARYAVNGAGLTLCSRHSLVRKNGVGDLQKGERYCNMDFIILSALVGVVLAHVVITYDIACQWSRHLHKRMKKFPDHMRIPSTTRIDTAIPSWHINGHGPSCRQNFGLGYMKGVGRTCGEEVEISWSHTNPLASSVREMAPIARHDTLNDHWNGWNFRKIVGFRSAFARKFKEAAIMQKKHKTIFNQFSSTFPAKTIKEWTKAVEKWEADPTVPNPYKEPININTLQDVRLQLAKEEAAEAAHSNQTIPEHKMSMTKFLTTGLELEDRQYHLRNEISQRKMQTAKEQADVLEKRAGLHRQIHIWRQAQLAYTPHAATMIASSATLDENGMPRVEAAEDAPLLLPSALPAEVRVQPATKRLCNIEMRLRKAEANDALFDIR